MTSHDVVARVRRVTGISRVGHAGTLDPGASGVLPIAVGMATRLLPYAELSPKIYRGRAVLGSTTLTGDGDGPVVGRSGGRAWSGREIHSAARWLCGTIWQVPPQVSALRGGGRRHYDVVRRGGVVWPDPRRVTVDALDEIAVLDDGWSFRCQVSPGTYVRALVRDWGYLMGGAAHLTQLVREAVGAFRVGDAVTLDQLAASASLWSHYVTPWQNYLAMDAYVLDPPEARWAGHGDPRLFENFSDSFGGRLALTAGGRLVGIAEGPPWRYCVVFEEGF